MLNFDNIKTVTEIIIILQFIIQFVIPILTVAILIKIALALNTINDNLFYFIESYEKQNKKPSIDS